MIHVLSLGAGVQSSTMALMASAGELSPMPACAIFADTQDEPASVYRWLDRLERNLAFPIVRVSIGKLSVAATSPRVSAKGNGYLKPGLPVYFSNDGFGKRHCSVDFKIVPILRYANLIRRSGRVAMWIGISWDEVDRMKPPREDWIDNHYPLVDLKLTREHCQAWLASRGYPDAPRSACVYCPYHSDDMWLHLKNVEPNEFARAVAFEKSLQKAATFTTLTETPYLHESRVPLETVTFVPGVNRFRNECEGVCGI